MPFSYTRAEIEAVRTKLQNPRSTFDVDTVQWLMDDVARTRRIEDRVFDFNEEDTLAELRKYRDKLKQQSDNNPRPS